MLPWPLTSRARFLMWLDLRRIYRDLAIARRNGQALLSTGRGTDTPERGTLLT